ncbi:alginate O-acetyltransferase [Pseudomonas sp. A46]|nr:alginate O-acetyltransferase [Pseudomonas sp. A46]OWJ95982.1 hypothetical protein B6S59_08630 [Pseudomonas sp. A46]
MKFPVMKSASLWNGLLFIGLLFGMFLYSLPAVFSFGKTQTDAWSLFVDGKLLRKFEQFYDKRFFLRDPSVRAWADIRFMLFGEGTSGVVIGKDGWLFTNQEYLVTGDLPANLKKQVETIVQVRRRLAENGKKLVLLPVPMKLDIYSVHARVRPDPRAVALYDRFVEQLQAQGVEVTPVRNAFLEAREAQTLFLPNDTHWSPEGARLAAQAFARQKPGLVGATAYRSEQVGIKPHKGDLMNYVQFDTGLAAADFRPVSLPLFETLKAEQQVSDASLFGDEGSSLLLVGTSYSKIDDWNFVGFMKESLKSDLVSLSQEAHGPFQAMELLLQGPQLADPAIDTVIWEFPVRTLLAQNMVAARAHAEQPSHF